MSQSSHPIASANVTAVLLSATLTFLSWKIFEYPWPLSILVFFLLIGIHAFSYSRFRTYRYVITCVGALFWGVLAFVIGMAIASDFFKHNSKVTENAYILVIVISFLIFIISLYYQFANTKSMVNDDFENITSLRSNRLAIRAGGIVFLLYVSFITIFLMIFAEVGPFRRRVYTVDFKYEYVADGSPMVYPTASEKDLYGYIAILKEAPYDSVMNYLRHSKSRNGLVYISFKTNWLTPVVNGKFDPSKYEGGWLDTSKIERRGNVINADEVFRSRK